jgi:hypothetical protein
MPRGRPRKPLLENPVVEAESQESPSVDAEKEVVIPDNEIVVESKEVSSARKCTPPHLPRCQCLDVVGPGQAAFEDGPTGTIIIGDDVKNEITFKYMENGKEIVRKINKKR